MYIQKRFFGGLRKMKEQKENESGTVNEKKKKAKMNK